MGQLTTAEIQVITEQLVELRKKLLSDGTTALNPTKEWTALRKEISLLDKKLNADTKAKKKAADELTSPLADTPPQPPPTS